jgi:nucleotide-binding universal stress UspA family protein
MIKEFVLDKVKSKVFIQGGRAASDIIKFANENSTDLIVIATHGLTGLEHMLLGSVTEKVVRMAHCPVFTVKAFGKDLL